MFHQIIKYLLLVSPRVVDFVNLQSTLYPVGDIGIEHLTFGLRHEKFHQVSQFFSHPFNSVNRNAVPKLFFAYNFDYILLLLHLWYGDFFVQHTHKIFYSLLHRRNIR